MNSDPGGLAWVAVACLALAGCGPRGPRPLEPRLSSIQEHVLDAACATPFCHGSGAGESQLDLSRGRSYRSLVGVRSIQIGDLRRVDPGRPEASYLLRKLEGDRIVGERMPNGKAPLPPGQIAAIREWIRRGAPDD